MGIDLDTIQVGDEVDVLLKNGNLVRGTVEGGDVRRWINTGEHVYVFAVRNFDDGWEPTHFTVVGHTPAMF